MDKFLNRQYFARRHHHFMLFLRNQETVSENLLPKKMAVRYLLGQVLLMYANRKFCLQENGQEAFNVFFASSYC